MDGVQVQVHGNHHQDLHAVDHHSQHLIGKEEMRNDFGEEDGDAADLWLDNDQDSLLADVNDGTASIFCNDFPALPDFPCMSSSSSSSSTRAPVKTMSTSPSASSSSSAASWAVLKSDAEDNHSQDYQQQQDHNNNTHYSHNDSADAHPAGALSSTASMEISQPSDLGMECMDMMETFGYIDLFEGNEFFDPSSIFQNENPIMDQFQAQEQPSQAHAENQTPQPQENMIMGDQSNKMPEDDMASVFLEWLRSNRETVSAEDLRSVKIKKSTIECAARRLGGGKEAMKQLLKLVLEWVQTNHLQKRRGSSTKDSGIQHYAVDPFQSANPNPNPSLNPTQNPPISSPWMASPQYDAAAPVLVPTPSTPMMGFMGQDPFGNGPGYQQPNSEQYENQMLETAPTWPPSSPFMGNNYGSFQDTNVQLAPTSQHQQQQFSGYGGQYGQYQYFGGHSGEPQLVRLASSATKEARKKRMQRQRRTLSHHGRHHGHQQNQHPNQMLDQRLVGNIDPNCTTAAMGNPSAANWFYWPTAAAGGPAPAASPTMVQNMTPEAAPSVLPVDRPASQGQNYNPGRINVQERRQGWKPDQNKNLRFLLQKVLKQSDVGNLGRIVLPKKEAETHLPELEARDGISIAMEDIGTSRVWNMRYSFRYWPNNKSRMYLLENTGDFVRANGLQEGDFIVIYSDIKCNKYMIRGVKVRQAGTKSETKRPGKSQRSQHASTPSGNNGSSSKKQ
ncbi:hypothetical protein ACLB2K_010908 [Fragaria x ananassa]